jgi:hypothetical protein
VDILCDIDGTIADLEHRRHWLKSKPKNWKAFYSGLENDKPIESTITIIRRLVNSSGDTIIFCSGRTEENREVTQAWIKKHVGIDGPLYMRSDGDYRDDPIIKKELLDKIRQDGYNPTMAFEDRKRVKRMWVENGIFVFDVNQHDEEF